MPEQNQCYMCGANATSREHVPPLCLFPEKKDIGSNDFRKNLITVPSCDKHNSKKSKDDEFLLACITGYVGNNILAYLHNSTKVSRLFKRRGEDFINVISRNARHFTITTDNGMKFPVIEGYPDVPRLRNCFEHIARGLYFHEFQKRFKGKCVVLPAFINYKDKRARSFLELVQRRFAFDQPALETKGMNPMVFRYWICEPDAQGLIGLKMSLYQGADIYVSFIDESLNKPINLTSELIKSGNKVYIEFPDGKPPVEFN